MKAHTREIVRSQNPFGNVNVYIIQGRSSWSVGQWISSRALRDFVVVPDPSLGTRWGWAARVGQGRGSQYNHVVPVQGCPS